MAQMTFQQVFRRKALTAEAPNPWKQGPNMVVPLKIGTQCIYFVLINGMPEKVPLILRTPVGCRLAVSSFHGRILYTSRMFTHVNDKSADLAPCGCGCVHIFTDTY